MSDYCRSATLIIDSTNICRKKQQETININQKQEWPMFVSLFKRIW